MNRPRISVVMPVRGPGLFLADAIRSLTVQSVPVDELLVVDDGMHEDAKSALGGVGLNVIMLRGPGQGPAAARNVGLAATTGEIVGFLDDDDAWPRDKLTLQLARLAQYPDEAAVGGRSIWFEEWDHARDAPADSPTSQSLIHANLGAFLFRSGVFARIGHFDETHTYAEDVDFVLRMSDAAERFVILDHPTLYYRRHQASMTAAKSDREQTDFRRALFRSLKRRPRGSMAGLALHERLVSPIAEPSE
jgi:glycosyltransferase involved in cell wall biosynthesis